MNHLFEVISNIESILWSYFAIPLIIFLGLLLTIKLRFPQVLNFSKSIKFFYESLKQKNEDNNERGIPTLRAFFTSIGGCIGIGNIISVCIAVKIGGPGAVFWMWVAAFLGMVLKYSEVYLGIKFRIKNQYGSYNGGPMYYLQKAFNNKFLPILAALLLCIYGTEIYTFSVIVETININWNIDKYIIIIFLLIAVIYASSGGISRVGKISSYLIPIFVIIFLTMGVWILYKNDTNTYSLIKLIFKSAFTGHAAIGGFAGSSMLMAISQGVTRGCYSGDIGTGYAAIVHAEASDKDPEGQANLAILGIFIDTFIICTMTTFIILVTDTWKIDQPASQMTQIALSSYFPHMRIFMPFFVFLLGYSTLIAFFCVGLKCAEYISPKWGKKIYYLYAIVALILFSFVKPDYVISIMSICGGLLLCLNVIGIFKLRKELK